MKEREEKVTLRQISEVKCWHCATTTAKEYNNAYIEFASGDNWKKKFVWLCKDCEKQLQGKKKVKKA